MDEKRDAESTTTKQKPETPRQTPLPDDLLRLQKQASVAPHERQVVALHELRRLERGNRMGKVEVSEEDVSSLLWIIILMAVAIAAAYILYWQVT